MAVSQAFDTPLERLGLLPNGMNWRGGWDVATQYYQNDVATSPVNLASYILNGPTSLLGGADPTLNPDWVELSAPTTGVIQVNAGSGIAITGTATVPVVENIGILTIISGNSGIQVTGGTGTAPLNAIISNTGVLALGSPGAGIDITGPPTNPIITNNGVRSIVQGSGITINNANPNIPIIENAGVTSIVSGNAGLTITDPTGPAVTITNEGVLSVVAGTNISVTGDPKNPTINSAAAAPPVISRFQMGVTFPISQNVFVVAPSGGTVDIPVTLQGTFVASAFQSGVPEPNGAFVFDFSGWSLYSPTSPASTLGGFIDFSVSDTPVGSPISTYVVDPLDGGQLFVLGNPTSQPCVFPFPNFVLPVAAVRAAGLQDITKITITNNTSVTFTVGGGNTLGMFATFYANGPQ